MPLVQKKLKQVIKDDAYWDHQRRLVAEDDGHMGWTHDHFPGCNDMPTEVVDEDGKKTEATQMSLF